MAVAYTSKGAKVAYKSKGPYNFTVYARYLQNSYMVYGML